MENRIEKLSSKIYLPALILSLVVALVVIAMLCFGGSKFLVLKMKYASWYFYPVYILLFYVFLGPVIVPLLDYYWNGKTDMPALKKVYARIMPYTHTFYVVAIAWSIAAMMFDGEYAAYENQLTVNFLEQKVCIMGNMLYSNSNSCVFFE